MAAADDVDYGRAEELTAEQPILPRALRRAAALADVPAELPDHEAAYLQELAARPGIVALRPRSARPEPAAAQERPAGRLTVAVRDVPEPTGTITRSASGGRRGAGAGGAGKPRSDSSRRSGVARQRHPASGPRPAPRWCGAAGRANPGRRDASHPAAASVAAEPATQAGRARLVARGRRPGASHRHGGLTAGRVTRAPRTVSGMEHNLQVCG